MASEIDLLFSQPPSGGMPVDLVFGDDDAAPEIPVYLAQAAGRITGLRSPLVMRAGVRAQAGGRITGLRQSIGARYDINTARPLVSLTQSQFQDARPATAGATARHSDARTERSSALARWQDAGQQSGLVRTRWQGTAQLQRAVATALQQAQPLHIDQVRPRWQDAQARSAAALSRYQQALDLHCLPVQSRHQDAWRDRFAEASARHQQAGFHPGVAAGQPIASAGLLALLTHARQQDAWPPRVGISRAPVPPGPQPCYVPALPADLLFEEAANTELPVELLFLCRKALPRAGVVVPIRSVYIVINSITLHRVDTGAELHAHSFGMSLDYQSWTWSWQASLHHDAAAHLGRDSQGAPAELAVVVNGIPFRLRLERIGKDRRFSPTRWAVSGKGLAAILDAPWAPAAMSFGNAAPRSAQQLMADALTINGVSLGWGLDFGLTDWQVPAGAWAYRGSYIGAINDIAGAAGGYVQPHPTDAVLRVLPRYPVAPWDWGDVTPDFEIPAAVAEIEGIEYVDKPAYNGVFVGGIGAGVFGPFKKSGTAGDVLAPQVAHSLITDLPAFRQRGLAEISDTGRQEHVTLSMQVLPETGIIMPGQFVRYAGDTTVVGIVRSTSINHQRPKLRQIIGIETHA